MIRSLTADTTRAHRGLEHRQRRKWDHADVLRCDAGPRAQLAS
ncbi:hypothetical protein E2C01_088295 [Portunus trituberculatus]|uniref:Uncharacterized protein n=1 Tax=Portunus trituberculatus TaxID=210409 RepID=A0A5B7JFL0_PORTR|nr:hypothetical protein [Portunus trituberculatus]